MKSRPFLEKINTITILLYLICVIIITATSVHPFVSVVSALAAGTAAFLFSDSNYTKALFHLCIPLSIFIFIFNFFFNHNGITVLFYIFNSAVTKESLLYSLFSVFSFTAAVLWFSVLSNIIGSERIYDLFSGVSKNLAVIFSLTMSMIPNLLSQSSEITTVKDKEKRKHTITTYMLNLSALFSTALENSFDTAISMKARGALLPRQKQKHRLHLNRVDALTILLTIFSIFAYFYSKINQYSIYPYFQFTVSSIEEWTTYGVIAIFLFLPHIIVFWEDIKWKCIQSKI